LKPTKKPEALRTRTNEGDDLTTGDEDGANDF
jgi:hypothetical protein